MRMSTLGKHYFVILNFIYVYTVFAFVSAQAVDEAIISLGAMILIPIFEHRINPTRISD